jgi:Enoyl-(Acyl carrier protein) reductase
VLTITGSIENGTSNGGLGLAAMTKGGLNAVTRALAIEYAKNGIRVNGIAPGVTNTPMHPVEHHEMLGAFHPLGRIAEPSEIASAVLFLESAGYARPDRNSSSVSFERVSNLEKSSPSADCLATDIGRKLAILRTAVALQAVGLAFAVLVGPVQRKFGLVPVYGS